jgi:uncharacterized protein with HEPN domain
MAGIFVELMHSAAEAYGADMEIEIIGEIINQIFEKYPRHIIFVLWVIMCEYKDLLLGHILPGFICN